LLTGTVVEQGAIVDHCILDKDTVIGAGVRMGDGDDNTPNQAAPERLNTGLTVAGRRARIPAGAIVGRNVVIGARAGASAFGADKTVASGRTIGK
jgi:glucose-1-phosphate adenylyltransferase